MEELLDVGVAVWSQGRHLRDLSRILPHSVQIKASDGGFLFLSLKPDLCPSDCCLTSADDSCSIMAAFCQHWAPLFMKLKNKMSLTMDFPELFP